MRILILAFLFLPFISHAQKKKKKKENGANIFLMQFNMFWGVLDSSGFKGQKTLDTLYYPDKHIKAVGYYAINNDRKKTTCKVDKWIEYYENGEIKSQGNYELEYLLACRSAGPSVVYHEYEVGEWKYYYDNGRLKAQGIYKIEKTNASTGISNQIYANPIVTDKWLLHEKDGQIAINREKIILELKP